MAWFQQDDTRPHTDGTVLGFFIETFRNTALSNRFPPVHGEGFERQPLSPDMTDVTFSYDDTLQIMRSALASH
jgi:hypothetical protein